MGFRIPKHIRGAKDLMFIPLLCCVSDFIIFALCDEWLAHCVMMYMIAYFSVQEQETLSPFTFFSLLFWILLQDVTLYGVWGMRFIYLLPLYFISRSLKANFLVSRVTLCFFISMLFLGAHYLLTWYVKGGGISLDRSTLLAIVGNISLVLWFMKSKTLLGMLGNRFEER